ncbi:MAG TPA: hypothetical protein DDX39_04500 [Bacteroidales bacterium]|nr:MAG: hypothetical protein A2W98_10500 [Bacteroidetes bacterium GWF2_33_38]HBF87884.1 hypothetical protein [Bacteroidales bacterium]
MKKLIEDVIVRFEQKKLKIENFVDEIGEQKENSQLLISAGQIIAYDFCINELKRMVEYEKISNFKLDS